MKKLFVIASILIVLAIPVFAGPYGCPPPFYPGGWGPCPWGPCWGCDRGLGNAAAITGIVANGIGMVANIANTVRYQSQPTVTVVSPATSSAAPSAVTVTAPPPVAVPTAVPVTPIVYGGYYVNPPVVMPVMAPASAYRIGW